MTNFDQAFEKIIMVLWTPWMATNDAFFNGKYRIAKVVLDHGLFIARVFFALQYAYANCKLQIEWIPPQSRYLKLIFW